MCRSRFAVLFAVLAAMVAGCSSSTGADGVTVCSANTDCESGQICQDGACARLCTVQSNCPSGLVCSVDGLCVQSQAGAAPRITDILGNNSSASQRITDGLLIYGEALAGATIELSGAAGAERLTLRQQTATMVEAVLPADVLQGDYALVAVNLSGSDQQAITLTLPDLNGELLIQRINSATTEQIAGARVDLGAAQIVGVINNGSELIDGGRVSLSQGSVVSLINGGAAQINAARVDIGYADLGGNLPAHTHVMNDIYVANCTTAGALGYDPIYKTPRVCDGAAWVTLAPVRGPSLELRADTYAGTGTWIDSVHDVPFTATSVVTDSSGDFLTIASAATITGTVPLPSAGYTFEIVLALADYTPSGTCSIYHGGNNTTGNRLHLCFRNAGAFEFDEYARNVVSNSILTDGNKYHLAFVHENDHTFSIYRNGAPDKHVPPVSSGAYGGGTTTLNIGAFGTTPLQLYMIRLWDRPLGPGEIRAAFENSP